MGFFSRIKKNPGWLVISFQDNGLCFAHVIREHGSRPVVTLIGFFSTTAALSSASLDKLAREIEPTGYQCSTLLSSGESQLLSVEAPNVPLEELKTAIRWRLKDMLDYHIEDAAIDVMDIPVDKGQSAQAKQMFVVAARNHMIQERQELFAQAKIPLSVIDVPEMAQRNISALLEPEGRGVALLSFDARGGLLTVSYGGELYLARHIDIPLAKLKQAEEAQRNESYDRITLELQRSLDYFDRQFSFITLSKLVLGPLGDTPGGLREYLAANLYLPVEALDLEDVFDISNVPELRQVETQQRFFQTLGAALRVEETVL